MKGKKTIITILQVCVTLGILFWILRDPKVRAEMWEAITHANPSWLLAGFLCYGVVEVLAAFRWFLLLRVQEIKLPVWRVAALLMLGIFFNLFLPGGTGGDLVKVFFLWREIPKKKKEGLLSVLMDRVVGLVALIIISSVIVTLQYNWLKTNVQSRHLTWTLVVILISSLAGIIFSFIVSGLRLAHKLPARLPMRDTVIDLSGAYHRYARAWPASLAALAASFGIHAASFSVFYCASRALGVRDGSGLPLNFGAMMTVMPIILTISALPISVGGTGVREGLFVTLLAPLCGVSKGAAFMLSITGYLLSVVWGIIGGGIFLLYRPVNGVKISDIEAEVQKMEHEIAETE
jgi:uncharacterized membrane protein YbhN (UPF0104 family)